MKMAQKSRTNRPTGYMRNTYRKGLHRVIESINSKQKKNNHRLDSNETASFCQSNIFHIIYRFFALTQFHFFGFRLKWQFKILNKPYGEYSHHKQFIYLVDKFNYSLTFHHHSFDTLFVWQILLDNIWLPNWGEKRLTLISLLRWWQKITLSTY